MAQVAQANAAYPFASAPPRTTPSHNTIRQDSYENFLAFLDGLTPQGPQPRPDASTVGDLPTASDLPTPVGLPTQATDNVTTSGYAAASVHYEGGAWTALPAGDTRKRRSWAKAAGRIGGKEGYKFGDIKRTFVGAVRRKSGRDWKAAAHRSGGGEAFKLGDFTRIAVSNLFGDKHRKRGEGGGVGMGTMPRPEPLLKSTAELHQDGGATQGSLLDGVWVGFFNAAYAVGRLALLAGELRLEDVEDSEPSVMIGLPALAMLECAIRSAAVAEHDKLITFNGKCVSLAAVSAVGSIDSVLGAARRRSATEALGIFIDMVALASRVGRSRLSPAGLASLRARVLAVDGAFGERLTPEEDREVNGLVALAQSVGTSLSQMDLYRHSFGRVLRALGDEQRHEADMIKMMEDL